MTARGCAPGMGALRFCFLGHPRIEQSGQPIPLPSRKAQALLAYLSVTQRPHSRLTLASLFWGTMPETAALTNLRVTLSMLRRHIGARISANRLEVAFIGAEHDWLDVTALERAAIHKSGAPVTELYRGDLLDTCYLSDAPAFEAWLLFERERLRQIAIDLLFSEAEAALPSCDYAHGITAVRRVLAFEPWNEHAQRLLMVLFAANGQTAAALAQFEKCRTHLANEFGVEPNSETYNLYTAIRSGTWQNDN